MADMTRAQVQANAQGMAVPQGQVAGQGYTCTVAQAKVSMHMVGVTVKVAEMGTYTGLGSWMQGPSLKESG